MPLNLYDISVCASCSSVSCSWFPVFSQKMFVLFLNPEAINQHMQQEMNTWAGKANFLYKNQRRVLMNCCTWIWIWTFLFILILSKSKTLSLCMCRFKRNAALVASGVAKNVNRVCIHIKETMDDILYPYRRRPK